MSMKTLIAVVLAAAFALAIAPAFGAAQAVQGHVVAIQKSAGASQQIQQRYPTRDTHSTSTVGSIIGGALGALVGTRVTRNMGYSTRYAADAAVAALGVAAGKAVADKVHEHSEVATQSGHASGQTYGNGYEVVVNEAGNRTVAIFVPAAGVGRFHVGQTVYVIGGYQLVPAQ